MDARFKKVHSDPRFIKPKKDAHKVVIDERFAHMLKSEEFGSLGGVDKKGRIQKSTVAKDLQRFYKLEDEQSEEEIIDYARGGGLSDSSDEEEPEMEIEEDEGPWKDEVIPTGEETNRFACVNLDWDHVKAKDLYKIFDAFKPQKGVIKQVSIYPSEFGKERMALEAVQGPPSSVFGDSNSKAESSLGTIQEDEGKDFNMVALRKYQVERLKYYYAVAEFDSVETARAIFKACDGTEFESSSNFFDLRYIPDGMEFDDEPRDFATQAPMVYEPADFVTQALQHSNVKLTWDAEDPDRVKTTKRKFTKQDIKDMDFKAFLASDSEEEVDEDLKSKYKALVAGSEDEDEGEDMEITFAPGLSEKAAQRLEEIKEEKARKDETVFEANLRKQREKKKAKKMARLGKTAQEAADEDSESPSESGREDMDDPFFQDAFGSDFEEPKETKKSNKKQNPKKDKQTREMEAQSKAELELLLMDEDKPQTTHFTAKDVLKSEKAKSKKQKKKAKNEQLDNQSDFKLDLEDPRFGALLEDHKFHIDPTNPQFKKTNTMKRILSHKRSRNTFANDDGDVKVNEKVELDNLVSSVKRRNEGVSGQGKRQKH